MSVDEIVAKEGPRHRGRLILKGRDGELRRSSPAFRSPIHHAHHDVELNLVVRGTATYAMEGAIYDLKPGSMIWILPDKIHRLTRGPQLEMWVALFRSELFEPAWLEELAAQPSRLISSQELLSLDRLLSEVAQDSDEVAAYNAGIRYVLMRALRASQARSPAALRPVHPAVGRAVRLLRENGSADSLSELARAAGVTPHYLSRLLTEQTGRNFVDWRNRVRLDRFIEGYRPGANLLAAALEAGFGSYSRFHHTFTELIGCTPKEWVAQVDAGKLAPRAEASAPPSGFGLHGSGALLSPRQRWGSMTPLASTWIRDLVGDGFARRLAEALPTDHAPSWLASDEQPLVFTPAEIDDLVASLHHQDPDLAAEYGRLLRSKENTEIYARFCEAYVARPAFVSTALLMLIVFAWACVRTGTMALQPIAVRRQINGALRHAPRPAPETVRRGFIAAVSHFGVLREATVAAQAGGEPRAPDQLGRAVSQWSEAVFDGDVRLLEMTEDGLRPPAGTESTRPRKGPASQAATA